MEDEEEFQNVDDAASQQEEEEEEEEEAQELVYESEDSNKESPLTNRTYVTVNLDLLLCAICFAHLRPPLFQCVNGHVVCTSCRVYFLNKCRTCKLPNKYIRCLALEEMIESIKLPCSNNGCNKTVPYADLHKHEKGTCSHAPFFCPIPSCSFSGSFDQLSAHVDDCHKRIVERLRIGPRGAAPLLIGRNNPLYVIRVDGYEQLFLLVNNGVREGNALSMTFLGPQAQASECGFDYELIVSEFGKGNSLRMEGSMKQSPRKWVGSSYFTDSFLLVPHKFYQSESILVLIDIKRKNAPSQQKLPSRFE